MRNQFAEIGGVIRKRRELLGLLQPQLAGISGINRRTIQLVEAGKANPTIETLLKIADPLGLTIHLILKEAGAIKQPSL
jgi:transcriptional regulator with XRE-family HTH domain